jgi:hypothetical protein
VDVSALAGSAATWSGLELMETATAERLTVMLR